jgi:hypothetical protein
LNTSKAIWPDDDRRRLLRPVILFVEAAYFSIVLIIFEGALDGLEHAQ